jgi:predicted DNA-binding transcriptional regulator YafY
MTRLSLGRRSQKQRDRLAYIEFRLWFLGDASRRDLMERFGIAPAMATRDFTAYRELAPQNIELDGRRKVYVPTDEFSPAFEHDAERVLSAISKGFGDAEERQGASYLPCELPLRLNRPTLKEVAVVTRAIHQHQVLRVKYHSLKRGAANREIVPHALVDSGLRWHTRVFDRHNGEFRDLVISRIETAVPLREAEIHPHEIAEADKEWSRQVDLALIVHPGVTRPEIVEHDFGMRRGELRITVRAAIAGYVLQLWNVDCSPDRRLDPAIHRLCLKDLKSVTGTKSVEIAPGFIRDSKEEP